MVEDAVRLGVTVPLIGVLTAIHAAVNLDRRYWPVCGIGLGIAAQCLIAFVLMASAEGYAVAVLLGVQAGLAAAGALELISRWLGLSGEHDFEATVRAGAHSAALRLAGYRRPAHEIERVIREEIEAAGNG
jgi:hypothetical protein